MKYIPGLTLAQSTYNEETMKNIYEKVQDANRAMISEGIYHNDLHANNIIISDQSPLPEVIILDFGEASIGPKKPLFQE
jgi:RIO-like serine/threonine protein kinase